jgi:hypothetical protein
MVDGILMSVCVRGRDHMARQDRKQESEEGPGLLFS